SSAANRVDVMRPTYGYTLVCRYLCLIVVRLSRVVQCARRTFREDAMTQMVHDMTTAIGSSPAWQAALSAAARVAPTESTALLQGESGTGKEVIARLIHDRSPRRHGLFVPVNCAALPEQLLESELFGYERGAFTGAQLTKPGIIESAAHGVLFLDEVTE